MGRRASARTPPPAATSTAHGALPTATELAQLAGTSRGTAGTVLKDLREQRPSLHVVNANHENGTHQ